MSNKAIICVDDERSILVGLQQQIKQEFGDKYQIELAESAEEVLEIVEILKDESIEIILLITDQMMPGMEGNELIKKMKSLVRGIKCVILSGYIENEITSIVQNDMSIKFIQKPWEKSEIISIIEDL